jgi:hypothetical protein
MLSMTWDKVLASPAFSPSNTSTFRVRINRTVAVAAGIVDQREERPLLVDPMKPSEDEKSDNVHQCPPRCQEAQAPPGVRTDLRNPRFAIRAVHSPDTSPDSMMVSTSSESKVLFFSG